MTLGPLCALGWLAALPFCAPPQEAVVGYVEGEYVNVAPIDVARIESLERAAAATL